VLSKLSSATRDDCIDRFLQIQCCMQCRATKISELPAAKHTLCALRIKQCEVTVLLKGLSNINKLQPYSGSDACRAATAQAIYSKYQCNKLPAAYASAYSHN
jgi:hypothetical protein